MAPSILLVDDDAGFRSLALSILRAAGYDRIHETSTVAGALRIAVAVTPGVALVDVGLPDGDGLQLASRLASLPDPPRVVLISADPDATDDDAARSAGALGFLTKDQLFPERLEGLLELP